MLTTILNNNFSNQASQVDIFNEATSPEIIWEDDEVRLANEIEVQRIRNYVEHFALIREYEEIYGPYNSDRFLD